jgi:hypothetical protein
MVPLPTNTVRQPHRTTSSTAQWGYAASAQGSRASSPRTCDGRQLHPMASTCTCEIRGGPSSDSDHLRDTDSRNPKGQALP